MPGRLNSFQRTMLQWNELHPYNAVHVARLPIALDRQTVETAMRWTLTRLGLTGLRVDPAAGNYAYAGGPTEDTLSVLDAGADPEAALAAEIERQLNTPFTPRGVFSPFRFFLLSVPTGAALGVAYFHAMAGAESVVLLLREVVRACGWETPPALWPPVEAHPPTYRGWLWRHPGVVLRQLAALPAIACSLRRAHRTPCREPEVMRNGFTALTLPTATFAALQTASRAWGVTINDLFLAALLHALGPLAEARLNSAQRPNLAVGCVVNTRQHLGVDSRHTFGLFLGSFAVFHPVPPGVTLRALAADVRQQTARIKRRRAFMAAPIEMALARASLGLLSPERRKKFFPKHYPLWGGVTNINLNPLWPQPADAPGFDYLRAVCTGPATPLVLSPTTVGQVVNVGLTYRISVFAPPAVERLRAGFLAALAEAQA